MRKIYTILFFSLLTLFSCVDESNKGKVINSEKTEDLRFPKIIDTLKIDNVPQKESWLSTAEYKYLYIGKWQDSIIPDRELIYYSYDMYEDELEPGDIEDTNYSFEKIEQHKMYPYYVDWIDPIDYKTCYRADLSIVVDTTQRISKKISSSNWKGPYVEAYPVIIENLDKDTIQIGYGAFIPLITEAKDSLGVWRRIETDFTYMCGNGVGTIILPPNEIVLTAASIYEGDFETTLRLKIDSTFSNEFKGRINHRQFKSMYNKQGNYCDEYLKEKEINK
jgi:hypothetical protein